MHQMFKTQTSNILLSNLVGNGSQSENIQMACDVFQPQQQQQQQKYQSVGSAGINKQWWKQLESRLTEDLKQVYKKIIQDNLILTMKNDSTTKDFIDVRVKEIIKETLESEFRVQIENLFFQSNLLKQEFMALSGEHQKERKSNNDVILELQKQIAELQDKLKNEERKRQLTQQQLENFYQQINSIHGEYQQTLKNKEEEYLQLYEKQQKEKTIIQQAMEELQMQMTSLQQRFNAQSLEHKQTSGELEQEQRESAAKKEEIQQFQLERQEFITSQQGLERTITQLRADNENLQIRLTEQQEELEQRRQNEENLLHQNQELLHQIQENKANIESAIQRELALQSEIKESKTSLNQKVSKYKKKCQQLKTLLQQGEQTAIETSRLLESVKNESAQTSRMLEQRNQDCEALIQQENELKQAITEEQGQSLRLQNTKVELENQLQVRITEHDQAITQLTRDIKEREIKLQDQEKVNELQIININELKEANSQLQILNTQLQTQLQQAQNKIQILTEKVMEGKSETSSMLVTISNLESELVDTRKALEISSIQNTRLQDDKKLYYISLANEKNANEAQQQLEIQVQQLDQRCLALELELSQSAQIQQTLTSEKTQIEELNQKLQDQLIEQTSLMNQSAKESKQQLLEFEQTCASQIQQLKQQHDLAMAKLGFTLDQLKGEKDFFQQKFEAKQAKIKNLKQQIVSQTAQISDQNMQCQQTKQQSDLLEKKLLQVNSEISFSQEKQQQQNQLLQKLEEKIQHLQQDIQQKESLLQQTEDDKNIYANKVTIALTFLQKNAREGLAQLKEELIQLKQLVYDSISNALWKAQEDVATVQNNMDEQASQQKWALIQKLEHLEQNLMVQTERIQTEQQKQEQRIVQEERFKIQSNQFQDRLQRDNQELMNANRELTRKVMTLNEQIKMYEVRKLDDENLKLKFAAYQAEKEGLISQLQQKIDTLTKQKAAYKKQNEEIRQDKENLVQKYEIYLSELKKMIQTNQNIQDSTSTARGVQPFANTSPHLAADYNYRVLSPSQYQTQKEQPLYQKQKQDQFNDNYQSVRRNSDALISLQQQQSQNQDQILINDQQTQQSQLLSSSRTPQSRLQQTVSHSSLLKNLPEYNDLDQLQLSITQQKMKIEHNKREINYHNTLERVERSTSVSNFLSSLKKGQSPSQANNLQIQQLQPVGQYNTQSDKKYRHVRGYSQSDQY